MNNSTRHGAIIAAAISLTFGLSARVGAEEAQDYSIPAATSTQSISIRYIPADLGTEDSRAILQNRIRRAAERVCGPTNYRKAGSLAMASRNRKCVNDALEAAAIQLGESRVAALSR
ncbi:MAG: UrcA family protein [Pseudomonadales bacterium]|nr:UrcA family protein [Halioglobus sp.]MCP5194969.1 UrcA family protein [Pseudomonadales bacterium]